MHEVLTAPTRTIASKA